MQSNRKNSGTYFGKQQSNSAYNNNPKSINVRRKSVAVQTDNILNLEDLCNFSDMSIEDIRGHYQKTLNFLNNCHSFMNSVFGDGSNSFGDTRVPKTFEFRVPEVPNYFSVLEMFLEQQKFSNQTQLNSNLSSPKGNEQHLQDEEHLVFDLQQFLPKTIGDGPFCTKTAQCMESCEVKMGGVNNENVQWNGAESSQEKVGVRKIRPNSPSRMVQSEKDTLRKQSHQDLKTLSTTFEEILKTCNEFEHKSLEYLLKNDVPLNEPPVFPKSFLDESKFVIESHEHGDQKECQQRKCELLDISEPQTPDNELDDNSVNNCSKGKGFNLFEYALRNCKASSEDSDSQPTTPRLPNSSNTPIENLRLLANRGLLAENLPNILFNVQGIIKETKKPLSVLNQASQSQTPKKVNEMFNRISRESLKTADKDHTNKSEDSGEFVRFVEDDSDSLPDNCHSSIKNYGSNFSSSESIIWTDEEFQRRNMRNGVGCNRQCASHNEQDREIDEMLKMCPLAQPDSEPPTKSIPLKLNEKDKSLADEKVLRTIGLFTEKGDIRPGVISILEEKQRLSMTRNKTKNVKFRTERKFDLEVRFNNNNMRISDGISEESLAGSSVASQRGIAAERSMRSSIVSVSTCSTVSESDVMNTKPNHSQAMMKKI